MATKHDNRKKFRPVGVLKEDWSTFSKALPQMSENELRAALDYEVAHANRRAYVHRLHRKYNQVRYVNEQTELGILGVQS